MLRRISITTILLVCGVDAASAQQWAQKMFKVRSHDFGTVARSAKSEYYFELENPYAVDVHISSVRASCGCTTPQIMKDTLTTYEKSAIIATYNTGSFLGRRSATITVTIDKPRYAEVQLTVKGYIRSDVVIEPGSVAFGTVDLGSSAAKTVQVRYSGGRRWKILDVRGSNDHIEVELQRARQGAGGVVYDLVAQLKDTAPAGYFTEQLTLVTSDPRSPNLPLKVEGRVAPPVSVSPASLMLGVVQPGQQVTKKLVILGKQPFKIVAITPDDDRFKYQLSDRAKKVHIVPLTFRAGTKPGKVVETIQVQTDQGTKATATCSVAVVESIASK